MGPRHSAPHGSRPGTLLPGEESRTCPGLGAGRGASGGFWKYGILCPGRSGVDEATLTLQAPGRVSAPCLADQMVEAFRDSGAVTSWDFPLRTGFLNLRPVDGWSREFSVWGLSHQLEMCSSIPASARWMPISQL